MLRFVGVFWVEENKVQVHFINLLLIFALAAGV